MIADVTSVPTAVLQHLLVLQVVWKEHDVFHFRLHLCHVSNQE